MFWTGFLSGGLSFSFHEIILAIMENMCIMMNGENHKFALHPGCPERQQEVKK